MFCEMEETFRHSRKSDPGWLTRRKPRSPEWYPQEDALFAITVSSKR